VKRPSWVRRPRALRPKPPDPSTIAPKDAWQAAVDGEVAFWREFLTTKGARYPGSYDERLDPRTPLQPEIEALIDAAPGSQVRLLDVGAGPLTFLGKTSARFDLEITAVDALGEQYGALLDELHVTPPVRTEACETERLSERLAPNSFDLVAARNTLDHSYDPVRAIREMALCAKPDARLLLVHHPNTAESEEYRGMHQWNFQVRDEDLVVWRPGTESPVCETLGGTLRFERAYAVDAWEHVLLRKAADVGNQSESAS
jgi:SAM-dependent methyltransferase